MPRGISNRTIHFFSTQNGRRKTNFFCFLEILKLIPMYRVRYTSLKVAYKSISYIYTPETDVNTNLGVLTVSVQLLQIRYQFLDYCFW